MKMLFSTSEIQELKDCAELFESMKVNGVTVTCFEVINHLLAGNHIYSHEDILYAYEELGLTVTELKEIEWFDGCKLECMLPKVKQLLVPLHVD